MSTMRRGIWYVSVAGLVAPGGFMVMRVNKRFFQGNVGAQIGCKREAHEMTALVTCRVLERDLESCGLVLFMP